MSDLGEILVTPEQLQKMAEEWAVLFERARAAYADMETIAQKTETCFQGKAAELFRAEISKRTEMGIEKINHMKKFSHKLTEVAVSYQNAEGENKNVFGRN